MHTEDEAREMPCPETRGAAALLAPLLAISDNGQGVDKATLKRLMEITAGCLASSCPAWRWDKDSEYTHADKSVSDPTKGYCGKAGMP